MAVTLEIQVVQFKDLLAAINVQPNKVKFILQNNNGADGNAPGSFIIIRET